MRSDTNRCLDSFKNNLTHLPPSISTALRSAQPEAHGAVTGTQGVEWRNWPGV
jgi:hypothetical protein